MLRKYPKNSGEKTTKNGNRSSAGALWTSAGPRPASGDPRKSSRSRPQTRLTMVFQPAMAKIESSQVQPATLVANDSHLGLAEVR
jgi:hypothetical protein